MKTKTPFIAILILSVPCLYPWQELATAGGLGFIRNNFGWVTLVALTLLFSLRPLSQNYYPIPKFWLVGLLGCTIACLPFLFANHQFIENSLWLPFGLLLSWLFLLTGLNNQLFVEHKKSLLFLIIALCSIQVLIALWQLFHSYMMEATGGITEHKLPKVTGTFNQRNLYASFVTTALACAFYVFPIKSTLKVGNKLISVAKQNGGLLAFILLATFTLMLTDSRVGIYAFIVCLALLFIAHRRSWNDKLLKPTAVIVVAIIMSQLVINLIYDNKTKDFSKTASRQVIYLTSNEAIKDKPVLGHGLGSFEKAYLEKLSQLIKDEKFEYEELQGRPENLSHPHNELFYWGIQGGLVSILGLLIVAFSVLSLFRHTSFNNVISYMALLFPISFHLMVELPFYISTIHLIVYVLLIAFVIASIGQYKNYEFKVKRAGAIKVVSGLIASALIISLLVNVYSLSKAVKFEKALNPNLSDLDKVVLRLGWGDSYQSIRLRHQANRAAKLGLLEPQVEYLRWLEQQIEITPRLNYYFNLYAVNNYLGNKVQADHYYKEIQRLFVGAREAENWLEANKSTER